MKLSKEFQLFYEKIRISDESEVLREKRDILENDIKSNLPDVFEKHGIEINKSDINTFIQGSYRYKTTISADVVDMDLAITIPLDIKQAVDPRKIKGYLRDSIKIPQRNVTIKEPCVRASYYESGEEWLHMDLPLYALDGHDYFLARGKETGDYKWEPADPHGLVDYMCSKINGNDQLRRVICYIKKWRNKVYENASNDHSIPPSIGLTMLACDNFTACKALDKDDDLLSLYKTLKAIKCQFSLNYDENGMVRAANISKNLPVKPYSDVFEKMRCSSDSYILNFYKKICVAVSNLENAVNVEEDYDSAKYVSKLFGDEFPIPKKNASVTSASARKEHSFG